MKTPFEVLLGRKNYLFAGSHEGVERAAVVYSFFAMCKSEGVNPAHWLKYVLDNIQDAKTGDLRNFIPEILKRFKDVVARMDTEWIHKHFTRHKPKLLVYLQFSFSCSFNKCSACLTIGELKLYNIFSGFTDEQAKEIIATIEQFTRIVYNVYQRHAERPLN